MRRELPRHSDRRLCRISCPCRVDQMIAKRKEPAAAYLKRPICYSPYLSQNWKKVVGDRRIYLVWCLTSCLTPIWGRCIPLLAKEGWTRQLAKWIRSEKRHGRGGRSQAMLRNAFVKRVA